MPDFGGEFGSSGIPSFSFVPSADISRFINLSTLTDARLRALVGSTVLGAAATREIARRAALLPPPPPVPLMRPQLGPAIPGGERPPPPVLTPGSPTLTLNPPPAPPPGAMPPFRGLGGRPPGPAPAPAPAQTTFLPPAAMEGITQIQFGDGSLIMPLPIPLGSTREFIQSQRGPGQGEVPSFSPQPPVDVSLAVLRQAGLAVPGVSRVGLFQRVLNLARARRILLAINCAEALAGLDKLRRGEPLTIQELAPLVGVVLAVLGSEAATEGAITPELLQVALAGCAAGRDAVLIVQTAEQVIPEVRKRLQRLFRGQPTREKIASRARNQDDCQAACDRLEDREEISRCREACVEQFGEFKLRQGEPTMPFAIQNGRIVGGGVMVLPPSQPAEVTQSCIEDCRARFPEGGLDLEGCTDECNAAAGFRTGIQTDCNPCVELTNMLVRCQRDCGQPQLRAVGPGGKPATFTTPGGQRQPLMVRAVAARPVRLCLNCPSPEDLQAALTGRPNRCSAEPIASPTEGSNVLEI